MLNTPQDVPVVQRGSAATPGGTRGEGAGGPTTQHQGGCVGVKRLDSSFHRSRFNATFSCKPQLLMPASRCKC